MSLSSTQRYMGASAKNQQIANLKNTVWNWKKMIGRSYNDPLVQQEKATLPYEVIQMDNGMAGIKVRGHLTASVTYSGLTLVDRIVANCE